jgi:glutamine---fructose-6-phosphate transaminase (isomerizing)
LTTLHDELFQQPQALRNLVAFLRQMDDSFQETLGSVPSLPIFTGMGASYHTAWIAALHLNHLGRPALSYEASDLVNYAAKTIPVYSPNTLIYISQSGESGEVGQTLRTIPLTTRLIGLTNDPDSQLGRAASLLLPLHAGPEEWIASKTYLNTLALLWTINRHWTGTWVPEDFDRLEDVANRIEITLAAASSHTTRLMETFDPDRGILFLGHGPHAASARQAAMMLSEWAKVPAQSAGIAAYRHGFIESVAPGAGVILFAPPGQTHSSALTLASELKEYGAHVMLLQNGLLSSLDEPPAPTREMDEFLSPILDIIPIQLFAGALALSRHVEPGFRHIHKIVQKL